MRNRRSRFCDCIHNDETLGSLGNDWDNEYYNRRRNGRDSNIRDIISEIIAEELEKALSRLAINIEVNPEINIINDTEREVAIGKKGVGAGENTNIGIVGKDGNATSGTSPVV